MKTMMRYFKRVLPFVLVMVLGLGVTGVAAAAPAENFPVGVVDFMYLVNNHPNTAAANAALKTEQEQIRKEFETKSAGMNDKDKQVLDRQLGQQLEQKRQELLKPIVDGINTAMKAVASDGFSALASSVYGTMPVSATDSGQPASLGFAACCARARLCPSLIVANASSSRPATRAR